MTQSQLLVFTALPAGASPNGLNLSVFVSPKLLSTEVDPKLSSFVPWINWPAVRSRLGFTAHVRRPNGEAFATFDLSGPQIGSEAVWKKLFTPDTPVKAPPVEPSGKPASYNVAEIRNAVRDLYASYATRGAAFAAQSIPTRFGNVRRYGEEELQRGAAGPAAADATAFAFRSIQAFHLPAPRRAATAATDVQNPDFNARVSAVGQYPHLLRLLDLVVDFTVPADRIPPGDYEIAIVPSGPATLFEGVDTTVVSPWTSCRRGVFGTSPPTLEYFRPVARDGTADGLIDLRNPRYVVAIEDIDGAAYNVLGYLERTRTLLASETPGAFQDALPAVRNKGIQFFDVETADEIAAAKKRSEDLAAKSQAAAVPFPPSGPMPNAPILAWDDIVRGHRIDVSHENGPWRTLCARRTTLNISTTQRNTVDEEGFVTLALSSANPATGSQQKTSQILFRWNGWSLVAPRPGAALADGGTPSRTPLRSFLPIDDKALPGSLESLRFGKKVRFRDRAVDLAGNSWKLGDPAYAALGDVWRNGSPEVQYLRHEPVLPPKSPTHGDGGTMNVFVGLGEADRKTAKPDVTLTPPLASLDLVEKHGVFDDISPARSYALLKRTARSARGRPGASFIDPAYRGVVVRETWPRQIGHGRIISGRAVLDADSEPIKISGRTGSYAVTLSGHHVIAHVPPGGAMRLQIASYVPPDVRKLFDTHGASVTDDSSPGYELIAPSEPITVIHPVERPLAAPDFGWPKDAAIPVVSAKRSFGDTHAGFDDPNFSVATESTGRFDVTGEWLDVTDAPNGSEWPTRAKRKAHLFGADVPLPPNHPLASVAALTMRAVLPRPLINPEDSVYDFRDSKYRMVRLTAAAVSRFQNLYNKSPKDAPDRFIRSSDAAHVDVPNAKPPKSPNVSYIVPTIARSRPGSVTSHTEGWGLRVYMEPGDWFDSGDGENLAVLIAQPPAQGTLSQIAGDPIVAAGAVINDLTSSDFTNAISEHPNLRQVMSGNTDASRDKASDRALFRYVSASVFEVGYDFQKKLLYADIVMRRRAAYRPFVRLALARFQPKSVLGAHLSSTIFADFIQLTPERTLSVARTSRQVRLRLTGYFPNQNPSDVVRTRIVAIAQTSDDPSDEAHWIERERQLFAFEVTTGTGESVWDCTLPLSLFSRGSSRRIVVEEWEVWSTATLPDPEHGRFVYSEAIEL